MSKRQRGGSVRGSIELQAPGKLEVELLGVRSLLGTGKSGKVRVGRIARTFSAAGRVKFAVPLKRMARRVLADRKVLSLTAKVSVAAPGMDAFTRTRGVVITNEAGS